jgi:DNA-directed RNA polymerase subunit N (RpoN/RPB10)
MDEEFYGRCDNCWAKLNSRYRAFSRHVEQVAYANDGNGGQTRTVQVLHDGQLARYCCDDCARLGAWCQLTDRGIDPPLTEPGTGPVEPCTKCGKPVAMAEAHVAYEMMDLTEIRQPWLISVEPHDTETLAILCNECDADLAAAAQLEEENDEEEQARVAQLAQTGSTKCFCCRRSVRFSSKAEKKEVSLTAFVGGPRKERSQ